MKNNFQKMNVPKDRYTVAAEHMQGLDPHRLDIICTVPTLKMIEGIKRGLAKHDITPYEVTLTKYGELLEDPAEKRRDYVDEIQKELREHIKQADVLIIRADAMAEGSARFGLLIALLLIAFCERKKVYIAPHKDLTPAQLAEFVDDVTAAVEIYDDFLKRSKQKADAAASVEVKA